MILRKEMLYVTKNRNWRKFNKIIDRVRALVLYIENGNPRWNHLQCNYGEYRSRCVALLVAGRSLLFSGQRWSRNQFVLIMKENWIFKWCTSPFDGLAIIHSISTYSHTRNNMNGSEFEMKWSEVVNNNKTIYNNQINCTSLINRSKEIKLFIFFHVYFVKDIGKK